MTEFCVHNKSHNVYFRSDLKKISMLKGALMSGVTESSSLVCTEYSSKCLLSIWYIYIIEFEYCFHGAFARVKISTKPAPFKRDGH